jgi:uncharacterized protein involved in exopolysaccharide biosynthesis
MAHTIRSTITPVTLARALYRHKGKSLLVFLAVAGLAMAALIVITPKYESEAKLFVRLGRESVTLDPTATTGQTISVNESREVEINSIIEVLRSRSIAEKVVDRLTPAVVLGKNGEPDERAQMFSLPAMPTLPALPGAIEPSDRDRAIEEVEESFDAYAPKQTTVISLRYEADSPELAQQVVQAALEIYQHEHGRVHRTAGSYEFFVEQEGLLREGLQQATSELRDAKSSIGLASIEGRRQTLQTLLGEIETNTAASESDLTAAQAKAARLTDAVSLLPERLTTEETTGFPNVAADNMRQQLYQLEIAERELRSKYTADHPQVIAVRQQLTDARAILEEQIPDRAQTTSSVNPTRQQLELQLLTENAQVAALAARIESLRMQRGQLIEELKQLNHHEVRINDLEREASLLEASYRGYSEKLEQARIDDALEAGRISNVNVVQPASYVVEPVKPQKLLIVALGLAAAMAGAVVAALSAEFLDGSLRSSDDVERQLEVPVLLSIPRVAERGVLLN